MFGLCSSNKKKEKHHGSCGQKPKPSSCGEKQSQQQSSCGKPEKKKHSEGCGQKGGRSCKPGKVTRNAFFNFLREFRVKHCDWPVTKIAVEGAKCWCKMAADCKQKYIDMARSAPKMKRRRKHHSRHHRSERGGSCGKRRKARRRSHRRSGCR